MDVVERHEQRVIGLQVQGMPSGLPAELRAAWSRVVARAGELPALPDGVVVEQVEDSGAGQFVRTVGALATEQDRVAAGLVSRVVPAGRWVHHRHDGSWADRAAGFQTIDRFVEESGWLLGRYRLAVGYRDDEVRHPLDLYTLIDEQETQDRDE